ncbi:hypothetical protein TrLO_g908 [Triparma laevis f. longispina]|uniref:Uncharacterized protein n=1 Tax=Triparma laevis f. longispina TaxID=1714387 RepID=A0A9W6ZYF9_9STRA|nr:hypothetical protein TrLO_g908 [Triparma laevis f. longispina]
MRKRSTNKKEDANLKGKETKEANEAANSRNKPGSSNLAVIKILRGKVHDIKTVSRPLHSKLVKCVKEGGYFGVDGEKLKVKKRGALESIFFGWGVGFVGGGRWLWV